MKKNLLGLGIFASTGAGILISVGRHGISLYNGVILASIAFFFAISLVDHYKEIKERE